MSPYTHVTNAQSFSQKIFLNTVYLFGSHPKVKDPLRRKRALYIRKSHEDVSGDICNRFDDSAAGITFCRLVGRAIKFVEDQAL